MKVVVIGCTHAGTSAIVNCASLHPDAEIIVYERNDTVSFLSCGIALYVGGIINDPKGLFYSSPEALTDLGVKVKMKHDVLSVDTDKKQIIVQNLENKTEFTDSYDKLILTCGSWPIVPKMEGIELENILLCKNYDHSKAIVSKMDDAKNVVVVGGGYIGVELAEAFEMKGKKVTLIDLAPNILNKYLDKEFIDIAENAFKEKGITLALGEKVEKFEGSGKVSKVITDKGSYDADLVILCIGFMPNTEIVKGKVDMLPNAAIIVDKYMRTSNKDIFAAGDCATVEYNPTHSQKYIPLATNAIRMGALVARNLKEEKIKYTGTQGTSGIKIYDEYIASTGLTEEEAINAGFKTKSITVKDSFKPEFMPDHKEVILKVVYNSETRGILGGQIISHADYTQTINTLSVCIQNKMTMDDLAFVDQFFQPHFNKPWNILNTAGLNAK